MVKENICANGRKRIRYINTKLACFEDINFDAEDSINKIENIDFCFTQVQKIKFVNCNFEKGIKLTGSCDELEFVNCFGKIVTSDFSTIRIEIHSSNICLDKLDVKLLRKFNVYDKSTVYIKGPGKFSASALSLYNESNFVIETAKVVFDNVSLYDGSFITLNDSYDKDYPELKKSCEDEGEKLTCIYIMECGCDEGFIKSINDTDICVNGHFIRAEDKKMCDKNGFYKNIWMPIAYHFA